MKDIKVTDSVKYIGVDDHDIDLFESQYVVPNGVSYNSYVILDEKVAVMDTVDARKTDEWLVNLEEALDGRNVDYIVVSHMEPDHAASLQVLAEKYPEAKVVGNAKTFNMIPQFFTFDLEGRKVVVKEGDTLSLGSHTLQFVMAPMVHWPEVMVAYETSEKILFSADGFGKFGALDADEDWACEARRYYFNICGKYGVQVQNLLKKAAGLDIEIICPLHGPILKENLGYYIGLYDTWSKYEPENEGILIAYASIHGNTAAAAKKLAEILEAKGAPKVVVADLSRDDMAEVIEDAFRYDRLVLAAATYDAGIFPCMEDFLHHLKAKNYQKRKVAFMENGSWAPMAAKIMKGIVEGFKNIEMVDPVVTIKSTMNDENIKTMEELTESIRERGVLLPILVRKTNDEEFEIISGHRRTHAARLAGLEKVPVIIRELSDDDATIVMVDSNIQREEILPSEKAYAFQMKLEAIHHKGIKGAESREVVGEANGLSGRQVSRYIKLTNLLPELLEMVDEKKIAIKLAVEIAELSENEQQDILDYFNLGYKVSLEQVKAIKNKEKSTEIIERPEDKTKEGTKVTISRKKLKQYFPENYTKAEMENIIYQLLEKWKSDGYDI